MILIGVHYDRHGNRTGNAVTDNINDNGNGNRNVHENVDCNVNGDRDIDDTNSNDKFYSCQLQFSRQCSCQL